MSQEFRLEAIWLQMKPEGGDRDCGGAMPPD
jgi:hypothetical protein